MGVNADGRRELLGLKVGDSESEPFWREFLASLKSAASLACGWL
jgi:transposase-like protein